MIKIKHFYVDGVIFCKCNDKGVPINDKRMHRRDLKECESEQEKLYLEKMQNSGFMEQTSKASKWISFTMETGKPSHALVHSFAKLFSMLMEEDLPREIYRRKICCLFWIENNIERINEICKRKKIFAIEKKVHKIISPEESMLLINGSKNSAANADEILQPGALDTKDELSYNAQNTIELSSPEPQDTSYLCVPTKTDYTPPQFFPTSIIA